MVDILQQCVTLTGAPILQVNEIVRTPLGVKVSVIGVK
jgi:hypothetical protein